MTPMFLRARSLIIDERYLEAERLVQRAFALQRVKPPNRAVTPIFNIMAALVAFNLKDRDFVREACETALWQLEPGAVDPKPKKRAAAQYLQYYCKLLLELESENQADLELSVRYPLRFGDVHGGGSTVVRESFPVREPVPSEQPPSS
jgi:hypothetical protein